MLKKRQADGKPAAGAEVCPAGVTRDLKLARPLGQGLGSRHGTINEVSLKIFLRGYM
jgi:hypothetical protein